MAWRRHALVMMGPSLLAGMTLHAIPAHAQQSPAGQRESTLAKQLADSEAKVRVLQQRIERLEGRLDALTNAPQRPAATAPSAAQMMPQQASPALAPRTPPVAAASRPGSFEVDEDAAQRALERTLTESGALLLPQGAISVTPGLSYTRVERDTAVFADAVNSTTGTSNVVLANQTLRRNEFSARVDVKAGLPFESQLEVGLPYNYTRSSRIDSFGNESSANGSGIGDVTIGVAKTLTHEKGMLPDVIGRISYNTGTGRRSDNQVILNGGYRQLSAEFVALKRQDPLAFFAGLSYGHVFEEDNLKPGNVTNLSLGTVLAASPATSLQFGFTQVYRQKQETNGVTLAGTDETYGVVNIGASSVLSRDMMLLVSTGIGLGRDAPKYNFSVSLPISFR